MRCELFRIPLELGPPGKFSRVSGRLQVLQHLCALALFAHEMELEVTAAMKQGGVPSGAVERVSAGSAAPADHVRGRQIPDHIFSALSAMETHTPAKLQGRQSRYELLEVLGETRTSTVWLARDRQTGKTWAVKEHDEEERFLDELLALYAAHGASAHVVQLQDVVRSCRLIVLPLLSPARWDRISSNCSEVLGVMRTLLAGLSDLHACGLSHGDVKDSAIMVLGSGSGGRTYVLTDLDLSGPADTLFRDGAYCGTEGWIPYDTTFFVPHTAAQLDLVCIPPILFFTAFLSYFVCPGRRASCPVFTHLSFPVWCNLAQCNPM